MFNIEAIKYASHNYVNVAAIKHTWHNNVQYSNYTSPNNVQIERY